MLKSRSIGFPTDLSGLVNWPLSLRGCSFLFSQSALLSVFSGFGASFLRYKQVFSIVFEHVGFSAVAVSLVLILFVGVVVA